MRCICIAALTAVLAGSAVADNKDVARDAFREGTRQFDIGDFKSALAAFKKAYLNYEDPAFLFNIAQCERQLGDKAEARAAMAEALLQFGDLTDNNGRCEAPSR